MDLGKSGSCLPKHVSSPFLECRVKDGGNHFARKTRFDKSYWLSTHRYDVGPKVGYARLQVVSRCVVCHK